MNPSDPLAQADHPEPSSGLHLAVIGAGPVGLSLALHAAASLPEARITVFDAREADRDVSADPRTLALSLGSLQVFQRLGVWPSMAASTEAIREVHVSQQQPALIGSLLRALPGPGRRVAQAFDDEPEVTITAASQAVPQLGAVAHYGAVVAPLQVAWLAACAREPQRLAMRFGVKVQGVKPMDDGVELDADIAECFDLAVVAEGGVFAPPVPGSVPPEGSPRKGLSHDYRQTAWVGSVTLARPHGGVAYERFTPQGPAALLPLPVQGGQHRASLVWCVPSDDDPVQGLDDTQRLTVLNSLFHDRVGPLTAVSTLKAFPLGLNAEPTLVRGRTVRIGNAAQTLHPVAGQGLNLGLRDAMELVFALQRLPAGPTVSDAALKAALRRVEWQRGPDRWALIATTDFLARSFTWPVPGLTTVRGLGLAALQAAGPVKRLLARQMMFGRR